MEMAAVSTLTSLPLGGGNGSERSLILSPTAPNHAY